MQAGRARTAGLAPGHLTGPRPRTMTHSKTRSPEAATRAAMPTHLTRTGADHRKHLTFIKLVRTSADAGGLPARRQRPRATLRPITGGSSRLPTLGHAARILTEPSDGG